jgi:hypothetical protein
VGIRSARAGSRSGGPQPKEEPSVRLATGVGGAGNDFGSGSADCAGTFTIFDGIAPTFIQTGAAPFNGSFRPSESLAAFNGNKTKGTWRLLAFDDAGGTSGLVNCWVLGLKYKKRSSANPVEPDARASERQDLMFASERSEDSAGT